MLLFILPCEWVMVVGSLFVIHHVVVNMCSLCVRPTPWPFPGNSSLVVLYIWVMCVFRPDCFCHRDPHYSPRSVTNIILPLIPILLFIYWFQPHATVGSKRALHWPDMEHRERRKMDQRDKT